MLDTSIIVIIDLNLHKRSGFQKPAKYGGKPNMGKPSDKKRSARRLGRHERARVKKPHKPSVYAMMGGAGTFHVKAGRKKFRKIQRYCEDVFGLLEESHLSGEPLIQKSEKVIKRPLYTITFT